ncbi:MAG: helix-turn-helix domain-containing protein [Candidatus Paceibacterota bacterium]
MEDYLKKIGFTAKEATVYVMLLKVNNASATEIARATGIKRPTVYSTIEGLAEKGVVSETTVGKRTHYQAESPERLEVYLSQRIRSLKNHEESLTHDLIPKLKSIELSEGEKPVVKYYTGKKGALSAIQEEYQGGEKTEGPAYTVYDKDLVESRFSEHELDDFRHLRLKNGASSKALYVYSGAELPSDKMVNQYRIEGQEYPISCDIGIYKDRVRINTLGGDITGIVIHSKDIAETLGTLFNLAFEYKKSKKESEENA